MQKMGNVILKWKGKSYTVTPEGGLMRMLSAMQDHLPLARAFESASTGDINIARYAEAYSAALNIAGCKASSLDVYQEMTNGGGSGAMVAESVINIYLAMHPADEVDEDEAPKKKTTKKTTKSKKKTK